MPSTEAFEYNTVLMAQLERRGKLEDAYRLLRAHLADTFTSDGTIIDGDDFDVLDLALNTLAQGAGVSVAPIALSPVDGKVNL